MKLFWGRTVNQIIMAGDFIPENSLEILSL